MTDSEKNEVNEISERLDRIISTGKWVLGFVFAVVMAASAAQIDLMARVTSLETSRDSTAETIRRIDRNVEDMAQYLRGLRP